MMPYHDDDHSPPHLARHVDAWIRGDDNILLISGLSGAGKSVFARTLASTACRPVPIVGSIPASTSDRPDRAVQ